MLRSTFLGWQSWFLESPAARLLVDPLLMDDFGRGAPDARLSFVFWPPRRLARRRIPPIDAVVITHEHEDHLDIRSLARIDRSVPVFLSSRSSRAASAILGEMGFAVRALVPDRTQHIGDVELTALSSDLRPHEETDEWDTLAYLARHRDRDGSFFSNVDVPVTSRMASAVAEASVEGRASATLYCHQMSVGLWRPGLDLAAPMEAMHRAPNDVPYIEDGATAMATLLSGKRVNPVPGQTFVLESTGLAGVEPRTAFVSAPPKSEWPERRSYWDAFDGWSRPISGRTAFSPRSLPRLEAHLKSFAEYLYGRSFFRRLCSLRSNELEGRAPTFAWILFAEKDLQAYVYAYDPAGCRFVALDSDTDYERAYVGVVSCWATDLMALFEGRFEPRVLVKAWSERWQPCCAVRFLSVLWQFFHPLRHPDTCLAQYRRALRAEREARIDVHWSGRSLDFDGGQLA